MGSGVLHLLRRGALGGAEFVVPTGVGTTAKTLTVLQPRSLSAALDCSAFVAAAASASSDTFSKGARTRTTIAAASPGALTLAALTPGAGEVAIWLAWRQRASAALYLLTLLRAHAEAVFAFKGGRGGQTLAEQESVVGGVGGALKKGLEDSGGGGGGGKAPTDDGSPTNVPVVEGDNNASSTQSEGPLDVLSAAVPTPLSYVLPPRPGAPPPVMVAPPSVLSFAPPRPPGAESLPRVPDRMMMTSSSHSRGRDPSHLAQGEPPTLHSSLPPTRGSDAYDELEQRLRVPLARAAFPSRHAGVGGLNLLYGVGAGAASFPFVPSRSMPQPAPLPRLTANFRAAERATAAQFRLEAAAAAPTPLRTGPKVMRIPFSAAVGLGQLSPSPGSVRSASNPGGRSGTLGRGGGSVVDATRQQYYR